MLHIDGGGLIFKTVIQLGPSWGLEPPLNFAVPPPPPHSKTSLLQKQEEMVILLFWSTCVNS
jgi:hypothetical protein